MHRWVLIAAAALCGSLTFAQSVPDGGVLALDGKNRYVALDCPALRITGSPITVQAWFRTEDPVGIMFECGAANRDPSPQAGYALYMYWGKVRFAVNNGVKGYLPSLWDDVTTQQTYNDGKWHHATGVFFADGKTRVKIYVDGVEETSPRRAGEAQPALSAYTETKPAARIGSRTDRIRYPDLEEFFWNGSLDEVRVWTRALSGEEIGGNWNGPVDPNAPGLFACWKFSEERLAAGDKVSDALGDSHGVLLAFKYLSPVPDPFFPIDSLVFPVDDFDYPKYPAKITGYTGQDLQRIASVTWEKAERRRVGPRGKYKAGFTQLPDDRLLVATCERHPDSKEDPSKDFFAISVYESSDRGRSWRQVNETPLFGKEPSLVALPGGVLVLTAQKGDYRPGGAIDGIYTFRSQDSGRTWRKIPVDEGDFAYPYPRNIIIDEDGSLLYLRPRRTNVELCRSSDGGETWTFSLGKVNWDAGDMPYVVAEIAVLRLGNGRLLAALRREIPDTSGEGFEDTYLTESEDNGREWSAPWRMSGTAEVHAYLTGLADGRLLATYANYHHPFGIFAMVSNDDGRTWDREHLIQLALSADCRTGWPVTLQLGDGGLITSYTVSIYVMEEKQRTACEVVRWRLP